MRKTDSKQIGANTYYVTQLGGKAGRRAFNRYLRMCMAVAEAQSNNDKSLALASLMSDDDMDYFCDLYSPLTKYAPPENSELRIDLSGVFDIHFAGNYGDLMKWLTFCHEVNFGSFLAELKEESERTGKKE